MPGEAFYLMVLWLIGAFLLGAALTYTYGVIQAGRLRRSEQSRLDQDTARIRRAKDPHKRPF